MPLRHDIYAFMLLPLDAAPALYADAAIDELLPQREMRMRREERAAQECARYDTQCARQRYARCAQHYAQRERAARAR